jgi:hypothetical protein
MADRCYLEKCYDRLYPEFVFGGIARTPSNGREHVVFGSAADLVRGTPQFYEAARQRLDMELGGCWRYGEKHFGGENLYLTELGKNVRHAERIADSGDVSLLRRKPPETLRPAELELEDERLF